jgi:hypothetical protein
LDQDVGDSHDTVLESLLL